MKKLLILFGILSLFSFSQAFAAHQEKDLIEPAPSSITVPLQTSEVPLTEQKSETRFYGRTAGSNVDLGASYWVPSTSNGVQGYTDQVTAWKSTKPGVELGLDTPVLRLSRSSFETDMKLAALWSQYERDALGLQYGATQQLNLLGVEAALKFIPLNACLGSRHDRAWACPTLEGALLPSLAVLSDSPAGPGVNALGLPIRGKLGAEIGMRSLALEFSGFAQWSPFSSQATVDSKIFGGLGALATLELFL